jgi:hypothetical protein
MRRVLLALVVGLLLGVIARPSFGWGRDGHRISDAIAWRFMTDKAKACVAVLLGTSDFADAGNWADSILSERQYDWSRPLHYVNVPLDAKKVNQRRDCGNGGSECVLGAIDRFSRILSDSKADKQDRVEALKFLVHFVEDLHQPLHVAYASDRGGNDVAVKWFGQDTNIHAVWDYHIIEKRLAGEDRAAYLKKLRSRVSEGQIKSWLSQSVDPEAWANESLAITRRIYLELPKSGALGQAYYDSNIAAVEDRLLMAGVRLALVLNTIFAKIDLKAQPADFMVMSLSAETCNELGGRMIFITNNHPIATMRVTVRRVMTIRGSQTRKELTYVLRPRERREIVCNKTQTPAGEEATFTASVLAAGFAE